ncbi:MAG: endonuclease/exonuclease/phosphatase family protein [Acidimicrobiales bacterium]
MRCGGRFATRAERASAKWYTSWSTASAARSSCSSPCSTTPSTPAPSARHRRDSWSSFVSEVTRRRHPTVLCGDFNAGPDSDEIRIFTGRSTTAVNGLVFYDAC